MNRRLCAALLLFAGILLAQQGPPPHNPPTSPTFPQGQTPAEPLPPDTEAPPPIKLSNPEIQQQIQKKLGAEPVLANTDVNAAVDDKSVVLIGTVQDEQQHNIALRIAESYAGERQIVDKIQVQPQKT